MQLLESTRQKDEWKKRLNMPEGRSHSVGHTSQVPVPIGVVPNNRHEISIDSFAEIESRESFSKYPAHDDAKGRFNSHSIEVRENRHPTKVQIDSSHRERIDGIIKKHRVFGPMGASFENVGGDASVEDLGNTTTAATSDEEQGPPGIEFSQSVTDGDITRTYRSLGLLERLNKSRSVPIRSEHSQGPTSSKKKRESARRKSDALRRECSNEKLKMALDLGERVESMIEQSVCMITGRTETYSWYEPVKKVYDLNNDNDDDDAADEAGADEAEAEADDEDLEDKDYEEKPGDKVLYSKRGTEAASGWQPEDGLLFRGDDGSEESMEENIPTIPLVFSLGEAMENVIEGSVRNLTAEKSYEWKTKPKRKQIPEDDEVKDADEQIPEDDEVKDADENALDDERRQVSLTQKIVSYSLKQRADQEQAEGVTAAIPEIALALSIGEALEHVIERSVRNLSCGSTYEWKDGRTQHLAATEDGGDDWIPQPEDWIPQPEEDSTEAEEDPILPSMPLPEAADVTDGANVPVSPVTESGTEQEEDGIASIGSIASVASIEDSADALYAKNDFLFSIGYNIHKVICGSKRM